MAMLLLTLVQLIIQSVNSELLARDDNCGFRAAVYEHDPARTTDLFSTMLANVEIYSTQAKVAAEHRANIIVFPEYGITDVAADFATESTPDVYQIVPNPAEIIWNPCLQNATEPNYLITYHLSCIARENSIYLIANMPTQVKCKPANDSHCPSEGAYFYNTDIAFDTEGTVVSRYHKQNLYNEFNLMPPPQVEYAYFDTPFGRMGMVTCFDLVWYEPLIPLVTTMNIDTLIFPTAWMDQLPFLASVQSQEAYALGLGVNMLAANIHRPLGGFTGSGIYSPVIGAVNYTYDPNVPGKLLISELNCSPTSTRSRPQNGAQSVTTLQSTQLHSNSKADIPHKMKYQELHEFNDTNLSLISGQLAICHQNICCQVEYKMASSPQYGVYKLMAYAGGISEGNIYTLQAEICAVMWCQTDDRNTCSRVPTNITSTFESLSLNGQFNTNFLYPSMFSARDSLHPKSNWEFNKANCSSHLICANLNVTTPLADPLLVASIYGRKYEDDCWPTC